MIVWRLASAAGGGVLRELALGRQVFARFLDLVSDVRVALVDDREERALLRGVADVGRVEDGEHRVAERMDVAVDGKPRQRRLQLRDGVGRVLDALACDLGVVIGLLEGPLRRFELGLRALHVRVDRPQRGVDLAVARLQCVDL